MTRWNREGIRWRELSAAELTWLLYGDLVQSLSDNQNALRELFTLADDTEGLASLARAAMGQDRTIETTM